VIGAHQARGFPFAVQQRVGAVLADIVKGAQRVVNPVLLARDDSVLDGFNLTPGYINPGTINDEGKRLVDVLPAGNPNFGDEFYQNERKDIDNGFLTTMFQILTETPEMTATEVVQRTQEKGALLAPVMSRQQFEDLGPMIEREIDLLARQGLLPDMPPELVEAEGEFTIDYTSPLAMSQRAGESAAFMRLAEFGVAAAQQTGDKRHIRRLNFDAAMPEMADIMGIPARWLHSDDEVEAFAAQDTEQQQIQTAIEAAPAVAGLLKQGKR